MPNNYVLLERIELNASAASVTFSNIPQTGYTDLKVVVSARGTASSVQNITISFNASTTGFTRRTIYGDGATASSTSGSNSILSIVEGTNYTASTFSSIEMYVPNYTSSNNKSFSIDSVTENNATTSYTVMDAGLWSNTAAITSIGFTPVSGSFDTNSTFSLYGLAAVGTTPTIAPKASGGSRITTDGTYWYHTFLSTGAFVPQVGLTCDVVVVAGGGGGGGSGNGIAGGGGAGGFRSLASQTFASGTSYTTTVGAGGAGGLTTGTYIGYSGSNSSVAGTGISISATGGGRGAAANGSPQTPLTGGSGGGSSGQNQDGAAGNAGGYSPVEGYKGGNANATGDNAGGGGGAGAVGTNGVAPRSIGGGPGGAGTYSTTTTGAQVGVLSSGNYYLGGGGGGGGYYDGAASAGGLGGGGTGGGGTGGSNIPAGAATINTGGGGGGAGNYGAFGAVYGGGAGGSGVVIIRYPIA